MAHPGVCPLLAPGLLAATLGFTLPAIPEAMPVTVQGQMGLLGSFLLGYCSAHSQRNLGETWLLVPSGDGGISLFLSSESIAGPSLKPGSQRHQEGLNLPC